jgi:hypothetical protein
MQKMKMSAFERTAVTDIASGLVGGGGVTFPNRAGCMRAGRGSGAGLPSVRLGVTQQAQKPGAVIHQKVKGSHLLSSGNSCLFFHKLHWS